MSNKMGDVEVNKCDICQFVYPVQRKYYRYPVICECCNGKDDHHFEIVRYCDECEPLPPKRISVVIKPSETLKR